MQNYQIVILGFILAEYIRSLGMQAENMQREVLGESMAYVDSDFEGAASRIELYMDTLLELSKI
jgi:hypothetical protein